MIMPLWDDEDIEVWLFEAVLAFVTIAGLFATLFGLFFLVYALEALPV
ncbi:MAG TPA: hypothetical protein VD978_36440 [Azospirillum sp.]|nr:hypothetical protein [Azospirillum sp.]